MTRSLLFLALVGRHLARHRMRSFLTLLGVALGVAVAVAVRLANHTALASFESTVRAVTGDAQLQIVGVTGDLDERFLARMRPLTDTADFSAVIEGSAVLAGRPEVAFRLEGVDFFSPAPFRGYATPETTQTPDPEGLFFTARAAQRLGLHAGDRLKLWINDRTREVKVGGILPDTGRGRLLDPQVAFADIAVAQELLGRVGRLDRVDVLPHEAGAIAPLKAALTPLLPPGARVVEPAESNQQAAHMLNSFRTNLSALSFVALIIGAYLIYNAVAISVVQRRGEIATLRALGVTRGQVFGLFALEAGFLGLLGSIVGGALGALLATGAVSAVGRTVNSLYVTTTISGVAWSPAAFASGVGIGVGLSLVAALVPAFEAAGTAPALAMRRGSWEGRQRGAIPLIAAGGALLLVLAAIASRGPAVNGLPLWGYTSATLLILGFSLLAPLAVAAVALAATRPAARITAPVSLAVRNFSGAVGRNAVAVASLMVGVTMMIGVATMVGSFRETLIGWANTALEADLYLRPAASEGARFDPSLDPALLPALARVPGVAAVDGFRQRTIPFDGAMIRLGAGDTAVLAAHGSLILAHPGDVAALLRAMPGTDNVFITEALAIKHNLDRGQNLRLETPAGPHTFHIIAVDRDYQSDEGYVTMDRGTYLRYWPDPVLTSIGIYDKPGADAVAVRQGVQRVVGDRPITVTSNGEIREEVLRVFDNTFAITYALHLIAIAVSLLGVVSTLFALVLERQREISLLRYLGLTRSQVRTLVVSEAGLIGFTGALLGLGAGGLLSLLLIHVINRQSFGWTIAFHPPVGFIAGAFALVVATALLAGIYPARVAAGMPVAEGLRDE